MNSISSLGFILVVLLDLALNYVKILIVNIYKCLRSARHTFSSSHSSLHISVELIFYLPFFVSVRTWTITCIVYLVSCSCSCICICTYWSGLCSLSTHRTRPSCSSAFCLLAHLARSMSWWWSSDASSSSAWSSACPPPRRRRSRSGSSHGRPAPGRWSRSHRPRRRPDCDAERDTKTVTVTNSWGSKTNNLGDQLWVL